MVEMDHVLAAPEQLEDADLSVQVLPHLGVLSEELLPNHFHGNLSATLLVKTRGGGSRSGWGEGEQVRTGEGGRAGQG